MLARVETIGCALRLLRPIRSFPQSGGDHSLQNAANPLMGARTVDLLEACCELAIACSRPASAPEPGNADVTLRLCEQG